MEREEFEILAMKEGETIPQVLFEVIERDYMSDDYYHAAHGGVEEDKQSYINRVFGGKINTARTVMAKIVKEFCRANRWALRGNPSATPTKLRKMDRAILFHYRWMLPDK